ncbi:hypothetical protein L6164_011587 [Bauhinia variegata]|uniref:Uncharacterized protein n=1 Tax=Bauhinia variegata TaxID=167791 RepID=A0ACB9P6E4_BAUVA|nr:hypothetical protein L6164_011587 [Bauhinia variegata]
MDISNRARVRVGVVKKKPLKRAKKRLMKKIVDYLKSDTFMYAPLVSPLPSDFCPPPITLPSVAKVVELKKSIKEKKRLVEQVGVYLKSDVYMYAPLVAVPPQSNKEPLQQYKMVSVALSTERLATTSNLPIDYLGNESQLPQTGLTDQHILGYKETVKHTVYQSCRSTSASELEQDLFSSSDRWTRCSIKI